MGKLRVVFALFVLLPSILWAGDIVTDRFEVVTGRGLEINTNPHGVRVFINGIDRGLTPFTLENLPAGEHQIRLSREGFRERSFNVTVSDTSRLLIFIEMEEIRGTALISVYRQPGSPEDIALNPGIFIGALNETITAPQENRVLVNLSAGFHTIRVRAFGWEDALATVLIHDNQTTVLDIYMSTAPLRISNLTQSRRRFNPKNSGNLGITEYRFEVSAHGAGTITIKNSGGYVIHTEQLMQFDTWVQRITWNGRDQDGNPQPQGFYTVSIDAQQGFDGTQETSINIVTEINYSANIFPLSLENSIAGLTFAPMPHVLPAGSYQFETGILFDSFSAPPFRIGMRISPFDQFEIMTVFNVNLELYDQSGWGVTGSAKYKISDGFGSVPIAFAAGISYTWASERGDPFLSPGHGIGFYVPLALELQPFIIVLCPAAFWYGPNEYFPDFLIGAGVLYRGSWFNAGFSARYDIGSNKEKNNDDSNFNSKLLAGAEIYLFPPPSYLVFSLAGGMWMQDSRIGSYVGLGIGMIF
jgi:hypothetical protein